MNTETKTAIANLPPKAPATAVIAAWAGQTVALYAKHRNPMIPQDDNWVLATEKTESCKYCGTPQLRVNGNPLPDERTLRWWLLDGGVHISERKSSTGRFRVRLSYENDSDDTEQISTRGDSPEAAFQQAITKFAEALRQEAAVETAKFTPKFVRGGSNPVNESETTDD